MSLNSLAGDFLETLFFIVFYFLYLLFGGLSFRIVYCKLRLARIAADDLFQWILSSMNSLFASSTILKYHPHLAEDPFNSRNDHKVATVLGSIPASPTQ
jgi:hypothetical protein